MPNWTESKSVQLRQPALPPPVLCFENQIFQESPHGCYILNRQFSSLLIWFFIHIYIHSFHTAQGTKRHEKTLFSLDSAEVSCLLPRCLRLDTAIADDHLRPASGGGLDLSRQGFHPLDYSPFVWVHIRFCLSAPFVFLRLIRQMRH